MLDGRLRQGRGLGLRARVREAGLPRHGLPRPDQGGLLDQLGVDLTERSNVARSDDYRTSVDDVFVCGDMGRGQAWWSRRSPRAGRVPSTSTSWAILRCPCRSPPAPPPSPEHAHQHLRRVFDRRPSRTRHRCWEVAVIRSAELGDRASVLSLNEATIPAVTPMSVGDFDYYAGVAEHFVVIGDGAGFLILIGPGVADYESPNYRWFHGATTTSSSTASWSPRVSGGAVWGRSLYDFASTAQGRARCWPRSTSAHATRRRVLSFTRRSGSNRSALSRSKVGRRRWPCCAAQRFRPLKHNPA